MNLAEFASLEKLGIDGLREAVSHLEQLEAHPSWVYIQSLLARQRTEQARMMVAKPARTDTSDSYALRNAHLAGWVEALQYAESLPRAVREITERLIEREQRAVEQTARQEEYQ